VLAYIDFRLAMISGDLAEFTCLAGTMAQEIFAEQPAIRAACWRSIADHAATLEADIDAAIAKYGVCGVNAKSLALYTQAAVQGAFILAKAKNDPALAREMIAHLRRYVELTFGDRNLAPPAPVKPGSVKPARRSTVQGKKGRRK
jgi:TetR/AcrR family transcriptional repressor of nem operon